MSHGGDIIAEVLARHGVTHLFTLCGGHISPILTGAQARGLRVVDVRDEANAVFAADAVARMSGTIGVAAVTAGPGVTNTITAVKNAQMAQTPLVIFGGATATLLKGRGSLQDIDQMSIMKPITKWATTVKTVPALGPVVERACQLAVEGVPGPVFIEVPVDLLYPEATVREWYAKEAGLGKAKGIGAKAVELYIRGHLYRQFRAPAMPEVHLPTKLPNLRNDGGLDKAAEAIKNAQRPVIVVGSQALVGVQDPARVARALGMLGAPVFLGGMARGLLGRTHELQLRHNRGAALKQADVIVVCGFPFDFRLGYGKGMNRDATVIAANLSAHELRKNKKPDIAIEQHAGDFLVAVADRISSAGDRRSRIAGGRDPDGAAGGAGDLARGIDRWRGWLDQLRATEQVRDAEIQGKAQQAGELIDPVHFFLRMEEAMAEDAVLVVDGGDFVATASYIVRPRAPLSWLDPGVFGTLGVGGGFALGATMVRPGKEVWLVWGDGSSAYSLAEFDSYVRHGVAPIAVIGNDASWMQIAREQVEVLGTSLGCDLRRSDYHKVAEGYGGVGLLLTDASRVDGVLAEAKAIARTGRPVCINVHLRKTDFRKGSISM